MNEINDNTCVTFRAVRDDDDDFLLIVKPDEGVCDAFVGRIGDTPSSNTIPQGGSRKVEPAVSTPAGGLRLDVGTAVLPRAWKLRNT